MACESNKSLEYLPLGLDAANAQGVHVDALCRTSFYERAKVVLDYVLAFSGLVLTSPLICIAIVLVKLSSRGPAFYSQVRLGKNGRPFRILKLRTMFHNCESRSGVCWSGVGDPRVTFLGRWLRKTHIDELPQLWNVLRGEMSLVGPRPERPEFAPELTRALPGYEGRLRALPGVTGLAQVQLPPDNDLASVRRKLHFDLYYLDHAGFGLDLRLIACTACRLLGVPFAVAGMVFRIPREPPAEDVPALPALSQPEEHEELLKS